MPSGATIHHRVGGRLPQRISQAGVVHERDPARSGHSVRTLLPDPEPRYRAVRLPCACRRRTRASRSRWNSPGTTSSACKSPGSSSSGGGSSRTAMAGCGARNTNSMTTRTTRITPGCARRRGARCCSPMTRGKRASRRWPMPPTQASSCWSRRTGTACCTHRTSSFTTCSHILRAGRRRRSATSSSGWRAAYGAAPS